MNRILITGADSYIGKSIIDYFHLNYQDYYIEELDVKKNDWKLFDFSSFDIVFHVAGIAHVSRKSKMRDLYYRVNRDLTLNVAKHAKSNGVRHFVFMSSMIVYSSKETMITNDTAPNPDNFYGDSKLQAEKILQNIQSDSFLVSILRSPAVYGYKSRGNFAKLIWFVRTFRVFPNISNKRSMVYEKNLAIFFKHVIDYEIIGVIFPRDKNFHSVNDICDQLSEVLNIRILSLNFFNPIIKFLIPRVTIFNKVFSDFYYKDIPDYDLNLITFSESICETLGGVCNEK